MPARFEILVAEDDQDVRELIRALLRGSGFEVHTVRNGAEALERIRSMRPNAMILDINMPVMDGFSVLEGLKTRGCVFPVLVLTARHAADDVRRAISLGAKDYLTKPFTELQLQARIARLLLASRLVPPKRPVLLT